MKTRPKIEQIDFKPYHYRKVFGSSSYTNRVTMLQIYNGSRTLKWITANYDNETFAEELHLMNVNNVFTCFRARDTDLTYVKDRLSSLTWKNFFRYKKTVKSMVVYASKLITPNIMAKIVKIIYKYVY